MPVFLLISRHSSENCPVFNEKARKAYTEYLSKRDGLLKKHGIKMLGWWNVHLEHLIFSVLEIPSLDAFHKFTREPEFMALTAYSTYELKMASTLEEAAKMLRKAK
jgi:hypothetical protein